MKTRKLIISLLLAIGVALQAEFNTNIGVITEADIAYAAAQNPQQLDQWAIDLIDGKLTITAPKETKSQSQKILDESFFALLRAKLNNKIDFKKHSHTHIAHLLYLLKNYKINKTCKIGNNIDQENNVKTALKLPFTHKQFADALAKEYELLQQGYHVFYHGQRSQWGFQQDLTTKLINELAKHGLAKPLRTDFLYIQNPQQLLQPTKKDLEFAQVLQDELMEAKAQKQWHRTEHLFTNPFLFGNTLLNLECSWWYTINNHNNRYGYVNLYPDIDVFQTLNISSEIYEKYKIQLNLLVTQYQNLFSQRRLLQIAIPSQSINNHVFLRSLSGNDFCTTARSTLYPDPYNFLKSLEKNSNNTELENGIICIIPMTQAYLLNPNSDVKIFAYNQTPDDMTQYQDFLQKLEALVKNIVKDHIQSVS